MKGTNALCQIGDESAVSKALLPLLSFIIVGQTISIDGAQAEVIDERISITVSSKEKISKIDKKFGKINMFKDIYQMRWIEDDDDD